MIADLGDLDLVFELFVHEYLTTASINTRINDNGFLSTGHFVIVDQLNDSGRETVSQLFGLFVVEILFQLDIGQELVEGGSLNIQPGHLFFRMFR